MSAKKILYAVIIFSLIIWLAPNRLYSQGGGGGAQREVTITTYYPAPYGEYEELKSRKMWIGEDSGGELLDGGAGILQVGGTTNVLSSIYSEALTPINPALGTSAVLGVADSDDTGSAGTSMGVLGYYLQGSLNAGVYGMSYDPNGYAGYFDGRVNITGDIDLNGMYIGDTPPTFPAGQLQINDYTPPTGMFAPPSADDGIVVVTPDTTNIAIRAISLGYGGILAYGKSSGLEAYNNPDSPGSYPQDAALQGTSPGRNGIGVAGFASTTSTAGTPIGVRGWCNSSSGWAGYFTGGKGIRIQTASGTVKTVPDLAELLDFTNKKEIDYGDVVIIDPDNPDCLKRSSKAYDKLIAGVVSETPALTIGQREDDTTDKPLALAGRVFCKVTTENGPINIGDPLTSSSKPGYAMKATKTGPIVGKAMENLEEGEGKIIVLLSLGWYVAPEKY